MISVTELTLVIDHSIIYVPIVSTILSKISSGTIMAHVIRYVRRCLALQTITMFAFHYHLMDTATMGNIKNFISRYIMRVIIMIIDIITISFELTVTVLYSTSCENIMY